MDAILVARHVIEKAKEHNVALNFNVIDFKAAFDTIWRIAIWKMMRAIGVSDKLVSLIEALYTNAQCTVLVNGKLIEWFEVTVGVRQGCLLSPLFSLNLFPVY